MPNDSPHAVFTIDRGPDHPFHPGRSRYYAEKLERGLRNDGEPSDIRINRTSVMPRGGLYVQAHQDLAKRATTEKGKEAIAYALEVDVHHLKVVLAKRRFNEHVKVFASGIPPLNTQSADGRKRVQTSIRSTIARLSVNLEHCEEAVQVHAAREGAKTGTAVLAMQSGRDAEILLSHHSITVPNPNGDGEWFQMSLRRYIPWTSPDKAAPKAPPAHKPATSEPTVAHAPSPLNSWAKVTAGDKVPTQADSKTIRTLDELFHNLKKHFDSALKSAIESAVARILKPAHLPATTTPTAPIADDAPTPTPKPKSRKLADDKLTARLQHTSLKRVPKVYESNDGSCLFSAIAFNVVLEEHLAQVAKDVTKKCLQDTFTEKQEQALKDLRKSSCDWIDANRHRFADQEKVLFDDLASSINKPVKSWDDYLEKMRQHSTWGTYTELTALANTQRRRIRIVSATDKTDSKTVHTVVPEEELAGSWPYSVGLLDEHHWIPLVDANNEKHVSQPIEVDDEAAPPSGQSAAQQGACANTNPPPGSGEPAHAPTPAANEDETTSHTPEPAPMRAQTPEHWEDEAAHQELMVSEESKETTTLLSTSQRQDAPESANAAQQGACANTNSPPREGELTPAQAPTDAPTAAHEHSVPPTEVCAQSVNAGASASTDPDEAARLEGATPQRAHASPLVRSTRLSWADETEKEPGEAGPNATQLLQIDSASTPSRKKKPHSTAPAQQSQGTATRTSARIAAARASHGRSK